MLDNDSLSQLKELKQQIKDSKEYAEGVIKATQRKFGFLVTEDGQEIYLSPEEMTRAFPGDKVKIEVLRNPSTGKEGGKQGKGSGEKVSGRIERLLESPLREFAGRYIVKGKGHFVEPDLHRNNRWIFIPPESRKKARPGDFVYCRLSRHPFPHGKPQARVLTIIGAADTTGIEGRYMATKFQLDPEWPEDWQSDLQEVDIAARKDLTEIPFVTIDAASTQDMDDALYATATDSGWTLQIAIADPSALIKPGARLDKLARKRATSVYLPGHAISMLPQELANQRCSLLPQQTRPALVCTLRIGRDGHIESGEFCEAAVCSKAKLSYSLVAALLDGQESDETTQSHTDLLHTLRDVTQALLDYRRRKHLIIPARKEFRLVLNDQLKLDHIEPQEKSSAHLLVEECMVAANRYAAEFMGDKGLFIEHAGFRPERYPDVRKLAQEQLGLSDVDCDTLEGYSQLMQAIDDQALEFPLRAVLSRLLERSRLCSDPRPHQGMGLNRYTTITSPIRKYSDLIGHRIIKAKLRQETLPKCDQQLIDTLLEGQEKARQARYQLEQWLKCQYMEGLTGKTFTGTVTQINSNGFSVRLDQHLIEGFVETRQLAEKYSFDPMRLRLKSQQHSIQLNQTVTVRVSGVDTRLRTIRYQLQESDTSPTSIENTTNTTSAPAEQA